MSFVNCYKLERGYVVLDSKIGSWRKFQHIQHCLNLKGDFLEIVYCLIVCFEENKGTFSWDPLKSYRSIRYLYTHIISYHRFTHTNKVDIKKGILSFSYALLLVQHFLLDSEAKAIIKFAAGNNSNISNVHLYVVICMGKWDIHLQVSNSLVIKSNYLIPP